MPDDAFSPAPASAGTKAGVELLSPQDYETVIPNIPYPHPPVNQKLSRFPVTIYPYPPNISTPLHFPDLSAKTSAYLTITCNDQKSRCHVLAELQNLRHDEATDYLQKAVNINPSDSQTQLILAKTLVAQKRYDEAITALNNAISAAPHRQARLELQTYLQLVKTKAKY